MDLGKINLSFMQIFFLQVIHGYIKFIHEYSNIRGLLSSVRSIDHLQIFADHYGYLFISALIKI
jgi:hypothetical protein